MVELHIKNMVCGRCIKVVTAVFEQTGISPVSVELGVIKLKAELSEEQRGGKKALLEKEVLFQSDVETLIGERPYHDKHILDVDPNEKHPEGGISEGVPPYDPNITNQAPAAK